MSLITNLLIFKGRSEHSPFKLLFLQQSHNPRLVQLLGLAAGRVTPPVRGVQIHLAGLDEVLDTGDVVLTHGEVESCPVVVV